MTPYDTDLSKPTGTWKKSWATAQKAAGVKARIHDCRHHALTVLAEAGTHELTLKAIGGHMTREMVEHYVHVWDKAKKSAMDALDAAHTRMVQ